MLLLLHVPVCISTKRRTFSRTLLLGTQKLLAPGTNLESDFGRVQGGKDGTEYFLRDCGNSGSVLRSP